MKKQLAIIVSIIILMFTVSCASLSQYKQLQNESFSGLFTRVNKYIITKTKNNEYNYRDYKEFTDSDTVIELKNNSEEKIGILRNLQFGIILPGELVRFSVNDEVVIIGCSGVYSVYESNFINGIDLIWEKKSYERFRKRYLIVEVQSVNFTEKMYFEYGKCHLDKTGKFVDEKTYSEYVNKLRYGYYSDRPDLISSIATVNLWAYRDELQDWLEKLGTTVVFNRYISAGDMQQYGRYEEEKKVIMEYYGISEDDFRYIAGDTFKIQYIRNEERNWNPIVIDDNKAASQKRLQNIIENGKHFEKVAEEQRIQQLKYDAYSIIIKDEQQMFETAVKEFPYELVSYDVGKSELDYQYKDNFKSANNSSKLFTINSEYLSDDNNPYRFSKDKLYHFTNTYDEIYVIQWLSKSDFLGYFQTVFGGATVLAYFETDKDQKALYSDLYEYKGVYEYITTDNSKKIVPFFKKIFVDETTIDKLPGQEEFKKSLYLRQTPTVSDFKKYITKGKECSYDFSWSKEEWREVCTDTSMLLFPTTIHCTDGDVWYNGGTEVF